MVAGHGGKDFSQPKLGWVNLDRGFARGSPKQRAGLGFVAQKAQPEGCRVACMHVPSRRLADGYGLATWAGEKVRAEA